MLTLKGKQVTLKSFDESNITQTYLDWLSDPALMRYSNQRFKTHTMASCLDYFMSFRNTDNRFIAIYFEEQFIGTMTVYASPIHQTADIGILIGAQCQGKGLGKDAWKTMMEFLLQQGVRKVTGGTLRCNKAMVGIFEACGMQADGVRAAQELVDGVPQDIIYFAKFRAA